MTVSFRGGVPFRVSASATARLTAITCAATRPASQFSITNVRGI